MSAVSGLLVFFLSPALLDNSLTQVLLYNLNCSHLEMFPHLPSQPYLGSTTATTEMKNISMRGTRRAATLIAGSPGKQGIISLSENQQPIKISNIFHQSISSISIYITGKYSEYGRYSLGEYKHEEYKSSPQCLVFIWHRCGGDGDEDLPAVHGTDEERYQQNVVEILKTEETTQCYLSLESTVGEVEIDKEVDN